jgi:hypothetical protein
MSHTKITLPISIPMLPPEAGHYEAVPRRKGLYEWKSEGSRSIQWTADLTVDAWKLRSEFLECPIVDWLEFLVRAGRFDLRRISQNDFAEWQQLIRRALVTRPKEWKSLYYEFDFNKVVALELPVPIRFEWDGDMPIVRIGRSTVLNMMIATIQLDFLQGAEFRLCARQDCKSAPFQVSARRKIYCDSDCAHLVAVRMSRARAAKSSRPKKSRTRKHRDAERK